MTRYHFALLRLAAALVGLSLFYACSANSTVPTGVQGESNDWLVPAAKRCKEKLYVSSYKLDYVAIYCTKGHNQAPIGKITEGIDGPRALNVDRKGNLYVANTTANTVTEYAPGSLTRALPIRAVLAIPPRRDR